jgi:hypothetical protein
MDELELIKTRLAATPISELPAIGEVTGVSFGALFKIKYGTTKNPRWNTVQLLAAYYREQAA